MGRAGGGDSVTWGPCSRDFVVKIGSSFVAYGILENQGLRPDLYVCKTHKHTHTYIYIILIILLLIRIIVIIVIYIYILLHYIIFILLAFSWMMLESQCRLEACGRGCRRRSCSGCPKKALALDSATFQRSMQLLAVRVDSFIYF